MRAARASEFWTPLGRDSGAFAATSACNQLQVQSLRWMLEGAARDGAPLYLANLDFENAFNSVDHEAVWRLLTELNIPDIHILHVYAHRHYEADLCFGQSAPVKGPVFLSRGTTGNM